MPNTVDPRRDGGSEPAPADLQPGPSGRGFLHRLQAVRTARLRGPASTALFALAATIFAVSATWAWRNLPTGTEINWPLVISVGIVAVPLMVAINALEFRWMVRLVGADLPAFELVRFATLGSAANLLPVPGSMLVRAHALNRAGVGLTDISVATIAVGAAFAATTSSVAGILLLLSARWLVGSMCLVGGVAAMVTVHRLATMRWRGAHGPRQLAELAGIELASVGVAGLRIWLLLIAVDGSARPYQAFVLTVAEVGAAALGFFPAGLGLRELIAAALSPLVDLDPAVGLVATALDRLLTLSMMAVLSLALLGAGAKRRRRHGAQC